MNKYLNLFVKKYKQSELTRNFTYKLTTESQDLPANWDLIDNTNIFLSRRYLHVLNESSPTNLYHYFIGIYVNEELIGKSLGQFIDLGQLASFGERDHRLKSAIRTFLFKQFSANLLIIGNNMLTGQHAFAIQKHIHLPNFLATLKLAELEIQDQLRTQGKRVDLCIYKDFDEKDLPHFEIPKFLSTYKFSSQPNMVLQINPLWKTEEDYVAALTKKYRDQFKRCRKKAQDLVTRKMTLEDMIRLESEIYALYLHVAKHAPFNTFFLPENHFSRLKANLKEDFTCLGYFENEQLIGFSTLIENGETMETYFLGYDEKVQKEKMLYLNMLYDMIACSIQVGSKLVNFGRTALEIKSSVGALDKTMYGFMRHRNSWIQRNLKTIFQIVEPTVLWKTRSPFK